MQIDAEAAASEAPRLIKKIEREGMLPRHGKDLTKLLAALGRPVTYKSALMQPQHTARSKRYTTDGIQKVFRGVVRHTGMPSPNSIVKNFSEIELPELAAARISGLACKALADHRYWSGALRLRSCGLRRSKASSAERIWPAWRQRIAS